MSEFVNRKRLPRPGRTLAIALLSISAVLSPSLTDGQTAQAEDPPPIVEFLETAIAEFSRGTLTLFSTEPDRHPGTGPSVAWLRGETIGSAYQYDGTGFEFDAMRKETLDTLGDDCSTLSAPIDHPERALPSGTLVQSFTIRCHALDKTIPGSLTYSFYPVSRYIYMTVHSARLANGDDIETDKAVYAAIVRYMQDNPNRW